MTKEEFLKNVRKKILYIFDRDNIENELKHHIEESIYDLMQDGLEYEEAEKIAVEQMGDPNEIGNLLNKEHHPILGYLLLSTRVILVFILLPLLMDVGSILFSGIEMLTPTTVDSSIKVYKVNLEIEIPTHDIIIDNIGVNDDEYCLTYRAFINKSYSRINWSNQIHLVDSNGDYLGSRSSSSHNYFGSYGFIEFDCPKDNIIIVVLKNEERIEINLQEYVYEKN